MSSTLNQNDRTLLSAYLDGELAGFERDRAEQLLAGSEEARRYLAELRSIGSLSESVIMSATAGAAASVASAKLTGPAIQAAARAGSVAKGGLFASWGTAGLVGGLSIAAVTVGFLLTSPTERHSEPKRPVAAARPSTTSPVSTIDLDTSALLVPKMTPGELVSFAVDGTLPIDDDRSRFLCVSAAGDDSLQVRIRGTLPVPVPTILDNVPSVEMRELDSLARVVRMAVIQSRGGGVAIRPELPWLRSATAREIEQIVPVEAPTEVREQLRRSSRQLAALRRTLPQTTVEVPTVEAIARMFERNPTYVAVTSDHQPLFVGGDDDELVVTVSLRNVNRYRVEPSTMGRVWVASGEGMTSPESAFYAQAEGATPTEVVGAGGGPVAERRPATRPRSNAVRQMPTPPTPPAVREEPAQPTETLDEQLRRAEERYRRAMERIESVQRRMDSMRRANDGAGERQAPAENGSNGGGEDDSRYHSTDD